MKYMVDNQLPGSIEERAAIEKGRRLGLLISALDIPDEQKEAMLSLLPEMNIEQMEKLSVALEENYLKQATAGTDKEFASKMGEVEKEYGQTMKAAEKKATEQIEKIRNQLSALAKKEE